MCTVKNIEVEDLYIAMNIPGVVAVALFYLLLVVVGICACRKRKDGSYMGGGGGKHAEFILAGRNIGWFVGTLSITGIVLNFQVDI